jgi:hypothetical protein
MIRKFSFLSFLCLMPGLLSVAVVPAAQAAVTSTTSLSVSSPTESYGTGTTETFTVTITGVRGDGLPNGTVTVSNPTLGTLATITVAAGGTCAAQNVYTRQCTGTGTIPVSAAVNTYTLTATYSGNGTYGTSSGTATVQVTQATPKAAVATVSGAYGSTVTLSATNTGATGAAAPTGAASFTVGGTSTGGTPTCSSSGAVRTCTLNYALPPSVTGSAAYSIGVTFAADANYASSTGSGTLNVTQATATATIANAAQYYEKNVTLNETNTGIGSSYAAPTGNLTVKVGTQTQTRAKNCTEASDVETCSAKYSIRASQTAGMYTMTATFAADSNYAQSVATGTLTVAVDKSSTVVTATPDNVLPSGSTTLAATVSNTSHAALVPTGTVTFTTGSKNLGSCTLSGGTCSVSAPGSDFTPGATSTVTASYGGVATEIAASSGTTTLTVSANIVFTSVTHNFGEVPVGSSEVYTAKLTNDGPSVFAFTLKPLSGSSSFTQQTNCPASIAVNASCELAFTYTPTTAVMDETATWSVGADGLTFSPSDGGTLTGTGTTASGVTLTTAGADFGFQAVGTTSEIYGVVLANATSSPITLSFSQTDTTDFITSTNNCPATLQAYQTCNLQYYFEPQSLGYLSDFVSISATSGGNPVTITSGGNVVTGIQLEGTGD